MANEDVIERYETWINSGIVGLGGGKHECARFAAELAAALREAREDTRRLDWVESTIEDDTPLVRWSDGSWSWGDVGHWMPGYYQTAREAIDAAMKPPGGEGSGHE